MKKYFLIASVLILMGCKKPTFEKEWTTEQAPETFTAIFETTRGDFEMEIRREFSPKAADRLYQLVKHGYYDNAIFYRVVPDFVAQFGNTDTIVMNQWRTVVVPDEPVKLQNEKGTVSFARFGKDTRDLELFINLKDNPVLDTLDFENVKGFPALGKITKGMEVVEKLYSGYGEQTMSDENLYVNRELFYRTYPKLDLIKKAYLK
ncbi:peptidylprolyl isomerase [Flavobacterium sp.]|uniref:peptidylprolyl isomerase n=1 Tax=Flavobacterium sp. TaxID=239 RepID=UPI0039E66D50